MLVINNTTNSSIDKTVFSKRTTIRESVSIPISFDGWFTIYHIVLPTKEWFERESSTLSLYETVYYSDGELVYKYINGKSTPVDLNELINRNIEGTTISRTYKDYISICYLKQCYINICQ
jgi:hypothetical protein